MKLWIVVYWGNSEEDDGKNERDTCFLVRANSVESAANIGNDFLKKVPYYLIGELSDYKDEVNIVEYIVLLGDDGIEGGEEKFLLGPFIQHLDIPMKYPSWRSDQSENNAIWEKDTFGE